MDSSSSSRRFLGDFCVLGASGFYGTQGVVALADLAARYVAKPARKVAAAAAGDGDDGAAAADSAAAIVIVLAGRNPFKLAAMLPTLQQQADAASAPRRVRLEVLPVPVDVTGGQGGQGDGGSNLRPLALAAPVLLNCIRPVEYEWSERVMAACAEASTAYLDLCARPAFLSAVREMFGSSGGAAAAEDGRAEAAPSPASSSSSSLAPLVPGCGFDYALPDVGTWHALQAYCARNGGRMPTRVRTTFLVHTPPRAGGAGGGGFKLRLGAVDELLAPPAGTPGAGHRGWDPRRDDVRAALERAAARRRALEARGLATPSGRAEAEGEAAGRRWFPLLPRREPSDLLAGPRWTLPFFVGGAVEADLLRANLTEGVEDGCSSSSAGPPPPLQFDCRVALPPLPSPRTLLLLLLCWPLLMSLACPLLAALALGAALARRSPPGGVARSLYLAGLPYLTLGLVTADDDLARRSADASRFERVCVLSGGGGGGGGGEEGEEERGARSLRVSFRGSFAQSLTPQCIAAAAVCLLNQRQHEQAGGSAARAGPPAAGAEAAAAARPSTLPPSPRSRVLTPAQALARAPPPGCPSFLDMLCARHGLVIEEEELP